VLGDGEDGDDMGDGDDGDDEAAVDHLLLNGGVPGECFCTDCAPRVCAVCVWSCVGWRTVCVMSRVELCYYTAFSTTPLILRGTDPHRVLQLLYSQLARLLRRWQRARTTTWCSPIARTRPELSSCARLKGHARRTSRARITTRL
jgi:hypothetical protein